MFCQITNAQELLSFLKEGGLKEMTELKTLKDFEFSGLGFNNKQIGKIIKSKDLRAEAVK